MTSTDLLTKALSLPNGATFHRCALQVNPSHYENTFRGKAGDTDATAHADAIVQKALEIGVSVLAITDHNSVDSVAAFQRAATNTAVTVFPGFELTSSEGVHILCIYPLDCQPERLARYLGEFGITNTQPSSDSSSRGFADILQGVVDQGGVAIAAHVTNDKGLFKVLQGQARIRAWQSDGLLAIQIPGTVADLPHDVRQIVENRNADYRRAHPVDEDLAVAVINASDVMDATGLEQPSSTSWIKMSDVSIEGFRQAFLDPGSRIRLNSPDGRLEIEEHSELLAITWEGGFLDGAVIRFNPNLNVLVGGRGTGKSTVIESIRTALGLEPIGEDARKAYEGIVRHVLKNGTKVTLLVRTHRPAAREYRIERTIPNPPLVRDEEGQVSRLAPQDVLPRLEVYGQHEISELTKSPDKRTRLLDRFVESDEAIGRRRRDLRRELEKNRVSLLDVTGELRSIEDRLAALPVLEETLERFREAGLEERLKDQSLIVREERVLSSMPERLLPFRRVLDEVSRELPIDQLFISEKALDDLPGKPVLERASVVFDQLEKDIERIANDVAAALDRADLGIAAIRSTWEVRKRQVQAEYERILRELQKSRIDGEEFIRLRRQIEELRPLRERLALLRRAEREHADRRRVLLAEWEDLKAQEFRRLDRAAKKVSQRLRDRVKVEVTAAGNREPLLKVMREDIGGRLSEALATLTTVPDLSLTNLVEASRAGPDSLTKTYGLPPAQADRLAKAGPDVLMRIEELELPPTTAIQLNTAPLGEPPAWQALETLSTGQKATAVLLLLLLDSEAPLIVDQPEDDLDNRFITEGVVPRMRDGKQRRQFVFSTHNANIPVLGDAELIIGLTASGEAEHGHARVTSDHMGSIDSRPVRELVEEILEGGREAFEMRRRKYGF